MNEPFVILKFSNYVKPKPKENKSRDWVLNGDKNSFYQYIIDRKNGSPTNGAIIKGKSNLIYGKGLSARATKDNTSNRAFLRKILKPSEVRKMVEDFATFGEFSFDIIETRGGELSSITHLPKNKIVPAIENKKGEIERYWYSRDWEKYNRPENTPMELPAWNGKKQKRSVYVARPYQAGKMYFADPDYLSCLQYADLEEELANLFVNSVKNNLSAGLIVNVEGGQTWNDEKRLMFKEKVENMLTGSSNAGKFIISYNGEDVKVTVEPLPTNENLHNQWEYLVSVARQQILTGHRVTSPMLFGVKDNTGLGNNANELREAAQLYTDWVAKPDQDFITDALEEVLATYGIFLDLSFIPLQEDTPDDPSDVELSKHTCENKDLDEFLSKGEDWTNKEGYFLVCEEPVDHENDTDDVELTLASTGTARPNSKSEQDTEDIIIRYKYVGNQLPEREFCRKMMSADKVYRKEDILQMENKRVNPGFGPNGVDTYDIWLYKGGVACKHSWNRVIYLKTGTKVDVNSPLAQKISTSEARRRGYKVETNENLVSIKPINMPNQGRLN
jgi:hypothetical protein